MVRREAHRPRWMAIAMAATLTLSFTVSTASAGEPTPADRETVRALLREGDRHVAAADYSAALKAYEGAVAIIPVPTTLIEVARTQEVMRLLLEARDNYLNVTRMPPTAGEPMPFAEARAQAADLAARVAARIPTLQIVVRGAPADRTPRITVDGQTISGAPQALTRKCNPGKHLVVASLDGYEDARAEVVVGEAESGTAELSLTALAPTPALPATPPPRDTARSVPLPTYAWVAFGVSAVGVAAGSVTGLMSLSRASSAREFCTSDDKCTPEARSDIDSSTVFAHVANIAFGVALVSAGVGFYGLLTRPRATRVSTTWVPLIGVGGAGVATSF